MALFVRAFRRRFSQPFTYYGRNTVNQNLFLKFFLNKNTQRLCFCSASGRSNSISKYITSDYKNENSNNNSVNGFIFIPAGIFSLFSRKEEDVEPESELVLTIKRGILLIQKEEYMKAEQMLHVALKLAQEQQNSNGVTYVYDLLANLAYEQQQFRKAEKLFINVIQRLITSGFSQTDKKVVHISLKLANIYKAVNEKSKAEEGYKFCIGSLKSKTKDDDDAKLLYAMSLDGYARFLVEENRLKEAFENFNKAYELCLQLNGENHEETVVLLNDLGTLRIVQEDYDSAVSYLTKAVEIGERLPDMKDFCFVLANLAAVYIKKGMYDKAKEYCNKALHSAKKNSNSEVMKEVCQFLDEIRQIEIQNLK